MDTCLHPALEFRKPDGTATSRLRSCVLVHQGFWPKRQNSGVLQLVRLHWNRRGITTPVAPLPDYLYVALRHRSGNEYRGLWRSKSNCP